jgi:hypothetical protein
MMASLRSRIAALFVVTACGGDDDGSSSVGESGADTSATGGMTTTMSTSSATSASTAGESGTSAATAMTGSGSAEVTGGSGDTTAGLECDPNASQMCLACLGEVCCDELQACATHEDCACMASCLGAQGQLGDCLSQCLLFTPPDSLMPLTDCMTMNCPDADECGTG